MKFSSDMHKMHSRSADWIQTMSWQRKGQQKIAKKFNGDKQLKLWLIVKGLPHTQDLSIMFQRPNGTESKYYYLIITCCYCLMKSKPEDFHVFTAVSIKSKPCCGHIQKHHKLLSKKGQKKERRILLPRERAKYIYIYTRIRRRAWWTMAIVDHNRKPSEVDSHTRTHNTIKVWSANAQITICQCSKTKLAHKGRIS